ncbi:MAG: hypothetical protein KJ630_20600 [Proteobacteria bacterium]|nr:hypothetical protein [Pseudomonadota bacterium]
MKKLYALFISLILAFSLTVSPVFAGGDQVQGDNAKSDSFGGETGNGQSPGNDAMGNQA